MIPHIVCVTVTACLSRGEAPFRLSLLQEHYSSYRQYEIDSYKILILDSWYRSLKILWRPERFPSK